MIDTTIPLRLEDINNKPRASINHQSQTEARVKVTVQSDDEIASLSIRRATKPGFFWGSQQKLAVRSKKKLVGGWKGV